MKFICSVCKREYYIGGMNYKCECGGLFKLIKGSGEYIKNSVSLGEMKTPILKRTIKGVEMYIKLDYMMPTGSYKDRGAHALINTLKEYGIKEVVEDSSGNAGAAIAAYCASAGIKCNIFLPESTSQGKVDQISAYGANIIKVPGTRDDTAKAVEETAKSIYYASHVYNPLFFEGIKSMAKEIYDEVGMPDYLFVPTGNGTMLLGLYNGFLDIGMVPKIIAVQSANCAPIYDRFYNIKGMAKRGTIAEGIAVGNPARIDEIIQVVKESGGSIITVSENKIKASWNNLCAMGIYAEYTSATVVAGALKYFNSRKSDGLKIVTPLSGMGLKKK